MYQQNNTTNGTYYNVNPYSTPYQQRYNGMEQGANAAPIYTQQPIPQPFLKGRPVSSFEEARAAAVGSFIILSTSSPAILPASFVACLWLSVK